MCAAVECLFLCSVFELMFCSENRQLFSGGEYIDIDIEIDVYWSNPQQVVAITTPRQEIKTCGS